MLGSDGCLSGAHPWAVWHIEPYDHLIARGRGPTICTYFGCIILIVDHSRIPRAEHAATFRTGWRPLTSFNSLGTWTAVTADINSVIKDITFIVIKWSQLQNEPIFCHGDWNYSFNAKWHLFYRVGQGHEIVSKYTNRHREQVWLTQPLTRTKCFVRHVQVDHTKWMTRAVSEHDIVRGREKDHSTLPSSASVIILSQ